MLGAGSGRKPVVRELYAAELRGDALSNNAAAWPFVDKWVQRHMSGENGEAAVNAPGRDSSNSAPQW